MKENVVKRYLPSQLLTALIAIAGVTLTPVVSNSQPNLPPCYLINDSGQVIDLGDLCGSGAPELLQARIKRRDGGIPVIDVTFNGRQTFEMLFDTGASGISITPQMAAALGVVAEGNLLVYTAGGTINVPTGRVGSVAVGGVTVNNLPVTINEYLELGLLGQGFFGNYDVTIRQNVIEFSPR